MKRTTLLTIVVLLAALLFTSCEKKDAPKVYRLTYSIFFPPVHVHTKLAIQWAEEIEKRTNGRVKIEVFPGSVLSGASENYDCVANGVSDLGMSGLAYSKGLFPLTECLDYPMGYPNGATATRIANAFLEHFKPAEFKDTHILFLHAHGPGILASTKPIENLNDFKNLSIRGTGISSEIIKHMGGNAVGFPQGETFEALRKGVVQGTLCPIETLKGWKQGEVISDVTSIPAIGYTTTMFVTMNLKTWNKLPADIQQIITEVTQEWIPKHGQAWDDADTEGRQFVTELGRKFHAFSPEENEKTRKLLEPMFESWIKETEAKGLPGREAVEFIRKELEKDGK